MNKIKLITFGFATAASIIFASTANADQITHTVEANDTLSNISMKYFGDNNHISEIQNENHISNPDLIYVGEDIVVNTSTPTSEMQTSETPSVQTNTVDTTDTSSVEAVAQQMADRTGVPVETWSQLINNESSNNPSATNSESGAYGYFQLLGHGEYQGMPVSEQIDKAVEVYKTQGSNAWVGWPK